MSPTAKRVISLIVGLFLLAYVGYQAYLMLYTSVELETVESYTVYETLDVQGIAIRDEKVINETASGYVYYEITNGDRVAKGGTIAEVYSSEEVALIQKEIEQIDAEIASLQSMQLQGVSGTSDLEALNKQIKLVQASLLESVRAGEWEKTEQLRTNLQQLLNRKQIVVGTVPDFADRLSELKSERKTLAAKLEKSQRTITSPAAGYFVAATDGYESVLSYADVTDLTVTDVETALDGEVTTDHAGIGKVVGDYVWYLACVVPQDKLALISEGQDLEIRLPFVTEEIVPVTVKKVNTDVGAGKAMVLLECSYMSEELSSVRCEEVRILLKEYTGLYVPDRALHFAGNNDSGVYVRVGNVLAFRHIRVLYYDETGRFSICEADVRPEEGDARTYLKLYDDMVIEGKGLYDGKVVA
ncbi:MAG: hypothetical protein IJC17_04580 [Clostridia bacterium]|nr:hypothetical protein [Clostridia bacterium]